jgi:hypothetical protein
MRTSTLLVPVGLSSLGTATTYMLEDDYKPAIFYDMFDFFTVSWPGCHLSSAFNSSTDRRSDEWICIICGPDNSTEQWSDQRRQRICLYGC